MTPIYKYRDYEIPGYKRHVMVIDPNELTGGINIDVSAGGVWVPDDEIPNLITSLQNYLQQKDVKS